MKFIVSSSALLKHLQQISGVINANTVLPVLEDFLFEIEKNKLIEQAEKLLENISLPFDQMEQQDSTLELLWLQIELIILKKGILICRRWHGAAKYRDAKC